MIETPPTFIRRLASAIWLRRRGAVGIVALAPAFAAVYYAAFAIRFEGDIPEEAGLSLISLLPAAVILKGATFAWWRISPATRFVTFHDSLALVRAATVSSVLLAIGNYLIVPWLYVPRSVFILDWGMTILTVGALMALRRFLEEGTMTSSSWGKSPVLIVGANRAGEAILRTLRQNPALNYFPIGFLSADASETGGRIGGVPVLGDVSRASELAEKKGVQEILIAAGDLPGRTIRQLILEGNRSGVSVRVLPSYEQILHGNVGFKPRTVSIEDLLRRDPVQLDLTGLHRWIDGQCVLVTGSAGSIGSELCRQLLRFSPRKLVLVDRSENGQFYLERELAAADLAIRNANEASGVSGESKRSSRPEIIAAIADINDSLRMERLLREHAPQIILHAAAYKHVPLMEAHPGEAVKNIVGGTRLLADLADVHGVASFVMISTDKAVNPTSIMGACKRTAELYVQSLAAESECRFVTVRFGNVLDSAGSVAPLFRDQIARGGPVTVTHPDMVRYFMTIPEASQLVLQAGAMGQGGEVFVLDMGEPVRILDLARDMIRLSGLRAEEDIEIQFVGVRPGEKLFEELHVTGEQRLPTPHPKILVAEGRPQSRKLLAEAIDDLRRAADSSPERVRVLLKTLVPQMQPAAKAA